MKGTISENVILVPNMTEWHASTLPRQIKARDTTISITQYDPKTKRTYEIQLCPTISLSVWLPKEEVEKKGSSHHIYGIIQINSNEDFDRVWKAIEEAMKKDPEDSLLRWTPLTFADEESKEAEK